MQVNTHSTVKQIQSNDPFTQCSENNNSNNNNYNNNKWCWADVLASLSPQLKWNQPNWPEQVVCRGLSPHPPAGLGRKESWTQRWWWGDICTGFSTLPGHVPETKQPCLHKNTHHKLTGLDKGWTCHYLWDNICIGSSKSLGHVSEATQPCLNKNKHHNLACLVKGSPYLWDNMCIGSSTLLGHGPETPTHITSWSWQQRIKTVGWHLNCVLNITGSWPRNNTALSQHQHTP